MSTALFSGLISAVVAVTVAMVSAKTDLKTTDKNAAASTEGIYAQQLPELLEKIGDLQKERSHLSDQLLKMQEENGKLRISVHDLNAKIDQLTQLLEKEGIKYGDD
ncbi:hypothetical protein [Lacticaseibacillus zhaodongensis]|uniref:hypothetical protein n=1 Tax=Lacticaseibacillus zhaodongensis TaxID=2668065 RepID=UPI0012D321BC|nr:hypothetical protein [Lacticaseibacillus zhaodongensis]